MQENGINRGFLEQFRNIDGENCLILRSKYRLLRRGEGFRGAGGDDDDDDSDNDVDEDDHSNMLLEHSLARQVGPCTASTRCPILRAFFSSF